MAERRSKEERVKIGFVFGRISPDGVEAVRKGTGVSASGKTLVDAMRNLERKEAKIAASLPTPGAE